MTDFGLQAVEHGASKSFRARETVEKTKKVSPKRETVQV